MENISICMKNSNGLDHLIPLLSPIAPEGSTVWPLAVHSFCDEVQVLNGYFSLISRLEGESYVRSAFYLESSCFGGIFVLSFFNEKGLFLVLGCDLCLASGT